MILKFVSQISNKKFYYELDKLHVGEALWEKDECTGGFILSDEELNDPELHIKTMIVTPFIVLMDIEPEDGKLVQYAMLTRTNGEVITYAWHSDTYKVYLMENGKTVDSF